MGKFQIFRGRSNSGYYFRLKSSNGEVILVSESYTSKRGCLNGIESAKLNSSQSINFIKKEVRGGQIFLLKATNGEIIGRSENYSTKASLEKGIMAVKQNAPNARIEDLT